MRGRKNPLTRAFARRWCGGTILGRFCRAHRSNLLVGPLKIIARDGTRRGRIIARDGVGSPHGHAWSQFHILAFPALH